jgi:hypothetical protein
MQFASGVTLTGNINTGDTAFGCSFTNTTGTTVRITHLSRWKLSGNSRLHDLKLYSSGNVSSLVATVTIDASLGTNNTFQEGALPAPGYYDLPTGATCYIIDHSAGLDSYHKQINSIGGAPIVQNILDGADIGYTGTAWVSGSSIGGPGYSNGSNGPVSFNYSSPLPGWTYDAPTRTYTTDGSIYSANSAINDATSTGVIATSDIVNIPATTLTIGASSTLRVNKVITVMGAGPTNTFINVAPGSPSYSSGGAILVSAAAVVGGFSITQPGTSTTTAIKVTAPDGWRLTNITYNDGYSGTGPWYVGYAVYWTSYGLIDNWTVNTLLGNQEPFFGRGPTDSWLTAPSYGTADATYIEDVTWNGKAYTDFNSNARGVVRFCTFNETAKKLDSHGYWTNDTPKRSVRHVEFYHNTFNGTGGGYNAIESRGGGLYAFFNSSANSSAGFGVFDYGYISGGGGGNFGPGVFMTPYNYPVHSQTGTGQFTEINATDLAVGQRAEIKETGTTVFTNFGATSSAPGTMFTATGVPTGTGTVYVTPAATEPARIWGNTRNGSVWPIFLGNVSSTAIAQYRTQIGNPAATFVGHDIIQSNRDFYADAGASTNTGAYIGTAAQMAALSPVGRNKHSFWVTNEGTWREGYAGTSGRLYVSDNVNWVLSYTPLTYPHPLRGTTPTTPILGSATINAAGTSLALSLSESCETGGGGDGGITLSATGGAVTWSFNSGEGTDTYTGTLSRTIISGEVVTVSYTQPGDGIESTAAQTDLASFAGSEVTNNSTVHATHATTRRGAGAGGGF